MLKLLKGGYCYSPEDIGKKDILIACSRIFKIEDNIAEEDYAGIEVIDCSGKIVCPGFIDQHIHITGGGGENGFVSRIPEIMLSDILTGGVTTVVGVLGFDGITRSIAGLLAKARGLISEGISAYIYTGSYGIPTTTLTGEISSDIALINEIIGVGEIAISDHRSAHPTIEMLKHIAYQARLGGFLGGKAGLVHIHIGDGKGGLKPLIELLEQSDFPIDMFIPTHTNRNKDLFKQAVNYCKNGGNIDLTAGENSQKGISVPEALKLLKEQTGLDRITVSSDGNGSIPSNSQSGSNVGKVQQLFEDIKTLILEEKIDISEVLKVVTKNPAKNLKLYPKKGTLSIGNDADILVLDSKDVKLDKVIARGNLLMDNGVLIKNGTFE